MTDEEISLLTAYRTEIERLWHLAQLLDTTKPDAAGAFTGSPCDRITRHLVRAGLIKEEGSV